MGYRAPATGVCLATMAALAVWAGAAATDSALMARAKRFWSFQPVQSYTPPSVKDSAWAGASSVVDRFILAKLEEHGFTPAPAADRATLLRRVTYDLTGLPPKPAELQAFLNDTAPGAYERVVDRLLASPHYGERAARRWMDLVRYAETDGHEFDNDKPNAWRYRDYLIRAFNEDVSYKQFALEHIAGDLLPAKRLSADGKFQESPLATAFYWLSENQNNPVDPKENTVSRVDNQIDVFSKTFLGLTVACARCHDHKFDPIPTTDYYAIAGFFHSMRRGEAAVETNAPRNEGGAKFAGLDWNMAGPAFTVRDGLLTSGSVSDYRQGLATSSIFQLDKRFVHVRVSGRGGVQLRVDEFPPEAPYSPKCDCFRWKTYDTQMWEGHPAYLTAIDTLHDGHVTVSHVLLSNDAKPPQTVEAGTNDPFLKPPDSRETCPETVITLAPLDDKPGDTYVHRRGNYKDQGETVGRRFLTAIGGDDQPAIGKATSGRLELAQRLVDEANPFFVRVMVNRIWQQHFGRGIVATPDNFGLTGEPPTHRELLDWLAGEFRRSGYSIKHLHRLMVLSNTYRMSSTPRNQEQDPANKFLSHMPVRRLEAEEVRDGLLAVAGVLDEKMFGPSVPVYVSSFMDGDKRSVPKSGPIDGASRRSIYINIRRNFLPDSLTIWDYPAPISTIGRRNASLVPAQALFLMNNELVEMEAAKWAGRLLERPATPQERIRQMYVEAFGRPPVADEVRIGAQFLESHSLADYAHALFNTTEFVFVR